MDSKRLLEIIDKQFNEKYYTAKELEYGNEAGIYLSPFEYNQLIEYKETLASSNDERIVVLPLPAFNYRYLYYSFCSDLKVLLKEYHSLASDDPDLSDSFSAVFTESRIYSEIEGTLNVENVPTTRRRLKELLENNAPAKDKNDVIIKNMKAGIDFVNSLPAFNKDNLFKLYTILSNDCLDDEDKLLPGKHYRHDGVEISRYHGCPQERIEGCMDALFEYVGQALQSKNIDDLVLLPHLCHYYLIYIHPYFDYNGRAARMVSYWIYLLSGLKSFPPIISEAINQTKNDYYKAVEQSRDSHNDLTYFLKYLLQISLDYILCYQNLSYLEQMAKNKGSVITETELNYIKRILISYKGAFAYTDFQKMINVSMSKQGALKILNKFVSYGFLKAAASSSKVKLFDIDSKNVPYALKNFGFRGRK